jgi:hypothetical protein
MSYVQRDVSGNIIGIYENPQPYATEFVANPVLYAPPLPLAKQAETILNHKTLERIQRAVITGRTTWTTPDVVAFCAYLDVCQAIATGKDVVSTAIPVQPAYPLGT